VFRSNVSSLPFFVLYLQTSANYLESVKEGSGGRRGKRVITLDGEYEY